MNDDNDLNERYLDAVVKLDALSKTDLVIIIEKIARQLLTIKQQGVFIPPATNVTAVLADELTEDMPASLEYALSLAPDEPMFNLTVTQA